MHSVVPKRKITLGTMLPLKSVETESGMADTLAETGTGTGVCRKKPKEYFDDAKTNAEVIPCIIGSSTKLKLSKMIVSLLRRKVRECAYGMVQANVPCLARNQASRRILFRSVGINIFNPTRKRPTPATGVSTPMNVGQKCLKRNILRRFFLRSSLDFLK